MRFKKRRIMKVIFPFVFASSMVLLFVFTKMGRIRIGDVKDDHSRLNKLEFVLEQTEFTSKILSAVSMSFDNYLKKCPLEDELRPISGQCLSSYGFSSTLLESIETLHILGLKERYVKAKELIKTNFSCLNLKWTNRRELFSRAIGALIGSYLLTRDSLFVKKACECADAILSFDTSTVIPPFINILEKRTRVHGWQAGSSLMDIISGLPELLSLYALTNSERYSIGYLSILNNLPSYPENLKPFHSFYNIETREPTSDIQRIDGLTAGFLHNLAIAQKLKPMRKLKELLSVSMSNLSSLGHYSALYPLYETAHIAQSMDIEVNYSVDVEFADIFALKSGSNYESFEFDATVLRTGITEKKQSIKEIITESLSKCKVANGFTGLRRNNRGVNLTDIQHSSFIGEWMNIAAWIASNKTDVFGRSVFNERGHLLYSPDIFANDIEN